MTNVKVTLIYSGRSSTFAREQAFLVPSYLSFSKVREQIISVGTDFMFSFNSNITNCRRIAFLLFVMPVL